MKWLKKKIEEHNDKITYVDYEESWTTRGWVMSLITFTTLVSVPFIIMAACFGKFGIMALGLVFGAISVVWHFWHLLKW